MKLKNFLGPSYTMKTINYDSQRCINWHPEYDEIQDGKDGEPCMLAPTPGYTLQHTLPRSPIRALYRTANNYIYCVAGNGLFLLTPTVTSGVITWAHTLLAYLTTSTGYVCICDGVPNTYQGLANTGLINQVVVVDGSTTGLVFQEATTEVYQMNAGTGYAGSSFVTFQDGFFIFSQPGTISGYYAPDPMNISDLNTLEVNFTSDDVQRVLSDHGIIWVMGSRGLVVAQNTGGSTTSNQFQQIPGAYAPNGGTLCPWTLAQVGGQILWVTNDDRGYGEVAQSFGYRPMRISNHAVEIWLQNLGDISQTIAWSYQEEGHTWYVLNNPNATTSWVYDMGHKEWHERAFFSNGAYSRDLANFHTNVFVTGYGNIHLVGDYQSGNLYTIDRSNYTHNGTPIRRERRTPHQSAAYKRLFYNQLQIDVQPGTGLDGLGYPVQVGLGTPVAQQATNVLVTGNGPTYTIVANDGSVQTPTSGVVITSTGASSNWSNSYTVTGNSVTINSANLTSTVAIGNGNGTQTAFQVPNIAASGATIQVYVDDWRGDNLQQISPATNTNLCPASYNFNISWTVNDATCLPGKWSTPDYTTNGTYLEEDSTYNPHMISVPYTAVTGQVTNLSIYATAGSNTTTSISGGTASFQEITTNYPEYTMTIVTPPTTGSVALGCVVNAAGLSSPQTLVALVSGTANTAGAVYLCYPGYTTNLSTVAFTGTLSTNRYLELALGTTANSPSAALFDLVNGVVNSSIPGSNASISPVTGFPGVYRCSIDYTENALAGYLNTTGAYASFSGSQMTLLQSPTYGSVSIGATVLASGVSGSTTIKSLVSGTLNQPGSVYSLSSTPGTIAGESVVLQIITPSTSPLAYVGLYPPYLTTYTAISATEFIPSYPGNGSAYVGIWGCQIGPQATVMPLVQTDGVSLYDQVTYDAAQGTIIFEIAPATEVVNSSDVVVQEAAVISATVTANGPQLNPTEYMATFTYEEGDPVYEYIGTNPQLNLSYSDDGGYTYTPERSVPIGTDGSRYKRLIYRKLGMHRDMVFKVSCSDPVEINLLGSDLDVKIGEAAK